MTVLTIIPTLYLSKGGREHLKHQMEIWDEEMKVFFRRTGIPSKLKQSFAKSTSVTT